VVGKYGKRGYVSHQTLEFGSILKFIETRFGLKPLTQTDTRASNLLEFFDFRLPPQPFRPIPVRKPTQYFLDQQPSYKPPDDD